MRLLNVALVFSFFLLTAYTGIQELAAAWQIDEDYKIKFSTASASGTFDQLQGTIVFDENNLDASTMDVQVDVNSINTGNSTKDKHARGESWFDAASHPNITFRSKQFEKTSEGYAVVGDLNMRGVQKEVRIPFTFEQQSTGGLFVSSFEVKRKDYGIKGPLMGFVVGKTLQVDLRVPVTK
ncbi:MAG: YceI family protein [Bacteroidota bacterium]